jgi:hypothetical protein
MVVVEWSGFLKPPPLRLMLMILLLRSLEMPLQDSSHGLDRVELTAARPAIPPIKEAPRRGPLTVRPKGP